MRNVHIEAFRRASLVVLHDLAWRWFGIPSPEVRAARQQRAEAEARAHEEAVRAWQPAMQPARDLGIDEQQAAIWTDLARSAAAGPLVPCYGGAPLQPLRLYPEFARFFPAWTPPAPAGGLEHACDAVRADMLDRAMKARTGPRRAQAQSRTGGGSGSPHSMLSLDIVAPQPAMLAASG
jgi:hypothetical protein